MSPFQGFIRLLSDPNIAFLLFSVGFYGLLFELQNPNFVTGILGALAIILAFIGFGSLPLNVGGLLLILLGMVLFGLELDRDQPRPARRRRAGLLRAGRVRPLHASPATRSSPSCGSPPPRHRASTATRRASSLACSSSARDPDATDGRAVRWWAARRRRRPADRRRPLAARAARLGLRRRRGVVGPDASTPAARARRARPCRLD